MSWTILTLTARKSFGANELCKFSVGENICDINCSNLPILQNSKKGKWIFYVCIYIVCNIPLNADTIWSDYNVQGKKLAQALKKVL